MFAQSPHARHQLQIVVEDAIDFVRRAGAASDEQRARCGDKYDVIFEDFAYEQPGLLQPSFWSNLRKLTARDGTLLVNTLFDRREHMDALEHDLRVSGWHDVRQHVDRGLQGNPC